MFNCIAFRTRDGHKRDSKDSKDCIVRFKHYIKQGIFLQLHIKMSVIKLLIWIQWIRHVKMIIIVISTNIGKQVIYK